MIDKCAKTAKKFFDSIPAEEAADEAMAEADGDVEEEEEDPEETLPSAPSVGYAGMPTAAV